MLLKSGTLFRITATCLLAALTTTAIAWYWPQRQQASVTIWLPAKGLTEPEYERLKNTHAQLLRCDRVLRDLGHEMRRGGWGSAEPDPRMLVAERLDVSFPGNGELMRLRMIGKPGKMQRLSQVLEALVDSYREFIGEKQVNEALNQIQLLTRARDEVKHEVQVAQQELHVFVTNSAKTLSTNESPFEPSHFALQLEFETMRDDLRQKRNAYRQMVEELREANMKKDMGVHIIDVVSPVAIGPVETE